jgi:hypothetical protein
LYELFEECVALPVIAMRIQQVGDHIREAILIRVDISEDVEAGREQPIGVLAGLRKESKAIL